MKPYSVLAICPNCQSVGMSVFYEIKNVPIYSVLLLPTHQEALDYPRGDIQLGCCEKCGFITNLAFDGSLHEYSARYEATQSYSPTFNSFAYRLATHLIERYNLYHKTVLEIGCGQGEFLTLLCQLGSNQGIGFDPAYEKERGHTAENVTFVADFYSERYSHYQADFICCKMTLEHIEQTAAFISTVRRSIGDHTDTMVFFQVPNALRVLQDAAFWDVYYEHCSYFSAGSLARVFRQNGFDIVDLFTDYDDQYLMIEARPTAQSEQAALAKPAAPGSFSVNGYDNLDAIKLAVTTFAEMIPDQLGVWRDLIHTLRQDHKKIVLWGGGSKGVAFLTTLNIQSEIEYAVDINPHKHGMFMAGTGQQIVGPEFLREYQPDVVIAMNPIYSDEIQHELDRLDVKADLIPV